jgi:hypothetical protein
VQHHSTPATPKRAAIYIRVSTEEQEENSSLESQRLGLTPMLSIA